MLVGKNNIYVNSKAGFFIFFTDTKMIGTIGFGHTLWRQSAQPHSPLHVRGN